MVISGCAQNNDTAVQQTELEMKQEQTVLKSFQEAQASGFTGTLEDWQKIIEVHQTNPQAATELANSHGMSNMIFAGLAGAAMGALAANAMSASRDRRTASTGSSAYVAPANRPNYSRNTATATRSTGTVARGGFGGAVSSGG
jgi:hypothetical protein